MRTGERGGDEGGTVFRSRNFQLFFFGQLVSNTGNWLQLAAQNALVLKLTGSSFMVGLTTAALFVPVVFFALPGGRLADLLDRRKLLIGTQVLALVATAVLAVLAGTGNVTTPAVLVVAVIVGIQYALSIPTMMALLPSLVEPEQLGMAIGMNSVTYNVARVLGPAVASALVASIGFGFAFGLNSLSFVALIVALLLMHPRGAGPNRAESGSIREALRYAWTDRRLRIMLLGVATVSIAMDPVITLGPTFATEVFGKSVAQAGYLLSAFGIGAIVAAFVATGGFRRQGAARFGLLGPWSLVYAGAMLVFAFSPSFWVAAAALLVAGGGFLVTSTNWTAGIQEAVPEQLRGRVMGIWALCFLGSRPFASVVDGAVADLANPRVAVVVLMIPLVLVAVFGVPALRRAQPNVSD